MMESGKAAKTVKTNTFRGDSKKDAEVNAAKWVETQNIEITSSQLTCITEAAGTPEAKEIWTAILHYREK